MFVDIFFSRQLIWLFQVKFSSNNTPKNLITDSIFIIVSLNINLGSLSWILSLDAGE